MNSLRRIVAVGLPSAGLTVAAALALSAPALATADEAVRPVVAVTSDAPSRGNAGYGTPAPDETDQPGTTQPTDAPATPAGGEDEGPGRGNPGYGQPTTAPASPTPSVRADTGSPTPSTPSGALPATTTPGGGVSAGGTLPVTGAPMGALVSAGALLVAAGGASVWYTRRRRSA